MGLNVDLVHMLKAPTKVECPRCNSEVDPCFFEDYDIDCQDVNPSEGKWQLQCYCSKCENEFYLVAALDPEWEVRA